MTTKEPPITPLRSGWTTGACATAATKAAISAIITGRFLDPVQITLPRGQQPQFQLAEAWGGKGYAGAGIIKDAGDDPDVTHRALIQASIRPLSYGSGIQFRAGKGVGTVTLDGLPLAIGEPAINPVPRQMIRNVIEEMAQAHQISPDFEVTIHIPKGEILAQKTWNPRLGILGGLSVLGTTGIVRPFSCAAWIASLHRGVDVARAAGQTHVVGSTGATSEHAAQHHLNLPDIAMLDMGDFVGGLLKYLRKNPIPQVTIAGGFGKLTKLSQGAIDLHSGRSQVDFHHLAKLAAPLDVSTERILNANTAKEVLNICGYKIAQIVAHKAQTIAQDYLKDAPVRCEVLVYDRMGGLLADTRQKAVS